MSSFDVFLSHNSREKEEVSQLAQELESRGISVWLDSWRLRPGTDWQAHLEEIISTCKSAIVCVGRSGVGPWEDPEMKALLRRFVNEKKSGNILPLIPVLLPGAPSDAKLPLFLEAFHSVDLSRGLSSEGLDKLQWGITGRKPESLIRADTRAKVRKRGAGWIRALIVISIVALAGFATIQFSDQWLPSWRRIVNASPQPTSSDRQVMADENLSHTFSLEDFPFVPGSEGGALASIRIESEPTVGHLSLPGIGLLIDQEITAEDVAQGKLLWHGPNDVTSNQFPPASFTFRVSDGQHLSDAVCTFTIEYASSRFVGSWSAADPSASTQRIVIHREADKLAVDMWEQLPDGQISSLAPTISLTTNKQDANDGQLTLANDTETTVNRYNFQIGEGNVLSVTGEAGNKKTLAQIGTAVQNFGQFKREE